MRRASLALGLVLFRHRASFEQLHGMSIENVPSITLLCLNLSCCRSIVERLSVPGVRRLFVVDPDTRRMEGIVSLSDVAAYLFDVF